MNRIFVLFVSVCLVMNGYAQENNNKIELSLIEAVEIALNNNPQTILTLKEIDAALGKILQAGGLENAELSIEANEIPSKLNFGETGELNFVFNQPFEFFGKRSTRIKSAELQKTITELNYDLVKKVLASQVKKIYCKALLSNQIVLSIESNINLLNDFLVQVTDRYQAGTSSYLDIIRAKVEILKLQNELFDSKKDYQITVGQLKILLGKENDAELELSDSLSYQFREISKDTVVNFYSSQSNFLHITEIQVEQGKYLLSLAEKKSLPDFNFGLAFQNRRDFSANGFDQYFGLNVGISLPMFYSSGVQGDIQEAEANLSISDIRYQYSKMLVGQNVKTAFNNLFFAQEQLKLFDTFLLKEVEEELRAGIAAYQNGQIDLLNLFDIYRTYRSTKVEYSRAVFNALNALFELEIAGEKWNTDRTDATD